MQQSESQLQIFGSEAPALGMHPPVHLPHHGRSQIEHRCVVDTGLKPDNDKPSAVVVCVIRKAG